MDTIFHEKQEGLLCAQHCLNALLQGEYFTAVDLATLAQQIDDEERRRMAEGGENSEEYRRFINAPSDNMDDSGFFSVQVIASALKVWSLDLIPYNSRNSIALEAQAAPEKQKAYICNYKEHWFTIRKIGKQWFNLNSLLSGPELISDTYLSLFLTQLQQEGYAIFIVNGILPSCNADNVLSQNPVVQTQKPHLLTESNKSIKLNPNEVEFTRQVSDENEKRQLEKVLQMSIESNYEAEKRQLEAALALSLENTNKTTPNPIVFNSEEEMLDAALKMSLEVPSTP